MSKLKLMHVTIFFIVALLFTKITAHASKISLTYYPLKDSRLAAVSFDLPLEKKSNKGLISAYVEINSSGKQLMIHKVLATGNIYCKYDPRNPVFQTIGKKRKAPISIGSSSKIEFSERAQEHLADTSTNLVKKIVNTINTYENILIHKAIQRSAKDCFIQEVELVPITKKPYETLKDNAQKKFFDIAITFFEE